MGRSRYFDLFGGMKFQKEHSHFVYKPRAELLTSNSLECEKNHCEQLKIFPVYSQNFFGYSRQIFLEKLSSSWKNEPNENICKLILPKEYLDEG